MNEIDTIVFQPGSSIRCLLSGIGLAVRDKLTKGNRNLPSDLIWNGIFALLASDTLTNDQWGQVAPLRGKQCFVDDNNDDDAPMPG